MGIFFANDNSGRTHKFTIDGRAPSQTEQQRIDAYIAKINASLPQPEKAPVEGGLGRWLGEAGKAAVREGVLGLTATPLRAVGGIGDYLAGNEEPGLLNRIAQGIEGGAEATMGPAPGWEDSMANTVGSFAGMAGSFILPGMAATKAVTAGAAGKKLTEEAAKALASKATQAHLATEIGMGAATGAAEAGRRADQFEKRTGQNVDTETRAIASLLGSLYGTSFALPIERISAPLAQVLKFAPKDRLPDVATALARRLKDSAVVGGVGVAQNVAYGLAQDLTEMGLYNPDIKPEDSVMGNLVAGGGVAGALHFLIGRSLAKSRRADLQLKEDEKANLGKAEENKTKMALDELSLGLGGVGRANAKQAEAAASDARLNAEAQAFMNLMAKDQSIIDQGVKTQQERGVQDSQLNAMREMFGQQYEKAIREGLDTSFVDFMNKHYGGLQDMMSGLETDRMRRALADISNIDPAAPYYTEGAPGRPKIVRGADRKGDYFTIADETGKENPKIYRSAQEALDAAKAVQQARFLEQQKAASAADADLARSGMSEAAKVARGYTSVELADLTPGERGTIRQQRLRGGSDAVDSPVSYDEATTAFGRERAKQLFGPRATGSMDVTPIATGIRTMDAPPEAYPIPGEGYRAPAADTVDTSAMLSPFGDLKPEQKAKRFVDPKKAKIPETPKPSNPRFSPGRGLEPETDLAARFGLERPIKEEKAEAAKPAPEAAPKTEKIVEEPQGPKTESAETRTFDPNTRVLFDVREKNKVVAKKLEGMIIGKHPSGMYEIRQMLPDGKASIIRYAWPSDIRPVNAGKPAAGSRANEGRSGSADYRDAGSSQPSSGQKQATKPADTTPPKTRNVFSDPMDSSHPVVQKLVARLSSLGLGDVQLSIKRWIDNDPTVEGRFTAVKEGDSVRRVIELAEGTLKPGMTDDEIAAALAKVMDHEIVHALKNMNAFGKDWRLMENYVRNKLIPGKGYTYLQQAEMRYPDLDGMSIVEEAVANAYRDFVSGDLKVAGKPNGMLSMITKLFKRIADWLDPTVGGAQVMERIRSGDYGKKADRKYFPDQKKNEPAVAYSRISPAVESLTSKEEAPTPKSEADIDATLGRRALYVTGGEDIVSRMRRMEHSAAADVLQKFIEPFTYVMDFKDKLMASSAGVEWKPREPFRFGGGQQEIGDYKYRAGYYADLAARKLVNRMIGLARFIDLIKQNGGSVTEAYDAYMKNDAVIGKVMKEMTESKDKLIQPLFDKIVAMKFSDADIKNIAKISAVGQTYAENVKYANNGILALYLYAKHAPERNAVMEIINPKGRFATGLKGQPIRDAEGNYINLGNEGLSGMKNAEAQRIIEYVEKHESFKDLLEAEALVREIIKGTNDNRVEGELIPSNIDFRYNEGPMAEAFRMAAFYNPDLAYLAEKGYRHYVPLRGFAEMLDQVDVYHASKARGLQFLTRQDMRALGRTSAAGNIVEHLILQHEESIMRKHYADVGRSFLKMLEENKAIAENNENLELAMDGMAEIVARVPMKPVLVEGSYQMEYEFDGKPVVVSKRAPHVVIMQDPAFRQKLRDPESPYYAVRRYKPDENGQVRRDENGRKVGEIEEIIIEIKNDNLRVAMKGAAGHGSETLGMIVDHIGRVTRFLANTVTSWNPEFLVANWQRDITEAMINAGQYEIPNLQKDVLKHALPAMKAIWKTNKDARMDFLLKGNERIPDVDLSTLTDQERKYIEYNRDFEADGGPVEFLGMRDLATAISHMQNQFTDPNGMSGMQKGWQAVKRLGRFVEAHNKAVENSTRLSVYIALREALEKQGMSKADARMQAAYAAKNITANYNRGGEWKPALNALYMFYNASIQGTYGLVTAAKRSQKVRQTIGAIMAVGLINDVVQGMISPTDDDGIKSYDKIQDWLLEHRMIFMDPFGMSDRGYIAIPMPYGYAMFYNFGRSIGRFARGEYDVGEAAGSAIGGVMQALNPITGSHSFANFMAPTILDPIVDLSVNRNYQNRPIMKEPSQYGVQAAQSQLYWNSASAPSIAVADWVNQLTGGDAGISGMIDISPDAIDYMAGFLTGGAGKFIARVTDVGWNAATGRLDDLEVSDIPAVRQVFGQVSQKSDVETYMSMRQRVLQPEKAMKMAMEAGDYQTAARIRQNYPDEMRLAGVFKAADTARNKLTTQIRMVRENKNLPEDRKAEIIKRLREQMSRYETNAIAAFNRSTEE